jgi:hypothetical protein
VKSSLTPSAALAQATQKSASKRPDDSKRWRGNSLSHHTRIQAWGENAVVNLYLRDQAAYFHGFGGIAGLKRLTKQQA